MRNPARTASVRRLPVTSTGRYGGSGACYDDGGAGQGIALVADRQRVSSDAPMQTRLAIAFRRFQRQDLAVLGPWLDAAGFLVPPNVTAARLLERLTRDPKIVVRTAYDSLDQPVGFLRLDIAPDRTAELTLIVHPDRRRAGIGSVLVLRALDLARRRGCRRVWVLVRLDNVAARRLFEDAGFEEDRRPLPGYIGMVRRLHRAPEVSPLEIPL